MQQGIPAPPDFETSVDPSALLGTWSVLAAAAVGIAIWLAVRDRDPLPVAGCVGAVICTANEGIFDVLGVLTYAVNLDTAYSAFGRDIPWTLIVGYIPWVGLVPYLLYRLMSFGQEPVDAASDRCRADRFGRAGRAAQPLARLMEVLRRDRVAGRPRWRDRADGSDADALCAALLRARAPHDRLAPSEPGPRGPSRQPADDVRGDQLAAVLLEPHDAARGGRLGAGSVHGAPVRPRGRGDHPRRSALARGRGSRPAQPSRAQV